MELLKQRAGTSDTRQPPAQASSFNIRDAIGGCTPLRSCYANHKAVSRVLPLYVEDLPSQIGAMTARLVEGDMLSLRRLVHGLRGSGGGYGFPDITRLATDAELAIDNNADRATIKNAVAELIDTVRRVEGYNASRESAAAA